MAHQRQVPALVDLLVRAFSDEEFYRWAFPNPVSLAAHFKRSLFDAIQNGLAYTTSDCLGAAIWERPVDPQAIMDTPAPASSDRFRLGAYYLEKERPHTAHIYLSILATRTTARRRGLGRAFILNPPHLFDQPVPIYLETTKESNIRFYQILGFEIIKQIQIPGGPLLWGLQRPVAVV
ncbi:hypothetical protein ACFLZW_02510 [Chloroflexota bacterium]